MSLSSKFSVSKTGKFDPLCDIWRCPECRGLNAWSDRVAEVATAVVGEEVRVCRGSCFDNICGHCGADMVRADSPIQAEAYTHSNGGSTCPT